MPVLNSNIKPASLAVHKQLSYEQLLAAWLSSAGWEVLIPAIDHGKKTDLVIADDDHYYRIQVKSIESNDESCYVENKWKGVNIDFVVYFSRTAEWGYIAPAFSEARRRLDHPSNVRFHQHPKHFLKAFSKI
ncbi:group I intron-associated PD-(D/E)XK endonuclease [Vogesella alkaliphila]|uniref:PD(D/E)XK endonuclease domain-containing protein n=1 Tax=Vogesella alkaliphila TaxID=1193621 RepID=A0ABQ2YRY3_9NEIS|nr:group I intron-associated PD-(D/E)XK endonuclease [Vogesella alkaliphila]GGX90432.1 hypothetical protein GCM10011290_17680 [Vogesella alkaliphila]